MVEDVITFDFLYDNFISGKYRNIPDFELLLEKYLDIKFKVFRDAFIHDGARWMNHIAMALEIGCIINPGKFSEKRGMWERLLDRKWVVDLDTRWVTWRS